MHLTGDWLGAFGSEWVGGCFWVAGCFYAPPWPQRGQGCERVTLSVWELTACAIDITPRVLFTLKPGWQPLALHQEQPIRINSFTIQGCALFFMTGRFAQPQDGCACGHSLMHRRPTYPWRGGTGRGRRARAMQQARP